MPDITFTVSQDFLTRFVAAAKGHTPIPTHPADPEDPGSPQVPDYTDGEWARLQLKRLIVYHVQHWEQTQAWKAVQPSDGDVTVTVK